MLSAHLKSTAFGNTNHHDNTRSRWSRPPFSGSRICSLRQEAAWRFIRWFTEAPQAARWAVRAQALPIRLSALELMTDTLQANPFLRHQVEEILPYGKPEPPITEQIDLRSILSTCNCVAIPAWSLPGTHSVE